jgi:thiol-disulfide isomerase/thioredoxin
MTLPRRLISLLILLGCFALAVAACAQAETDRAATMPGGEKATVEMADSPIDLAGYQQMVAGYRGKALMVTFWATWCEPCRDEYPMIVELAKKYAPQGLVVVGVSVDEKSDMNLVREFLEQTHPGFPNYVQKSGIDVKAFFQGVNPDWHGAMPHTVFYGRDGHIARYLTGASPKAAFENAIQLILLRSAAQNTRAISSAAGE